MAQNYIDSIAINDTRAYICADSEVTDVATVPLVDGTPGKLPLSKLAVSDIWVTAEQRNAQHGPLTANQVHTVIYEKDGATTNVLIDASVPIIFDIFRNIVTQPWAIAANDGQMFSREKINADEVSYASLNRIKTRINTLLRNALKSRLYTAQDPYIK